MKFKSLFSTLSAIVLAAALISPLSGFGQKVVAWQCTKCFKPFDSYSSAISHMCSLHGIGCNQSPSYVPAGPTPEQLRKQREEKDMREASDDAVDKGNDFFKRRDWNNAIKWYKEALDYNPDNDDALYNLKVAQQQYEWQKAFEKKEQEEAERKVKEEEAKKNISVKNTSAEAISNLKNTQEGLQQGKGVSKGQVYVKPTTENPGNLEVMKEKSGKVFDTRGDNRGSLPAVQLKGTITPDQEKTARVYLAKNDREYQARQIKLREAKEQVAKLKEKDDQLSKIIDDYKKNFGGKTAPKEEFSRYTGAIQEQQTVKGQLWNARSAEKTLKQKDEEAIKKYVMFGEKKIPGQQNQPPKQQ